MKAVWRRVGERSRLSATDIGLGLLTAGGVAVWLLLAGHVSQAPTVLGRWSARHTFLLALAGGATLVAGALGVPAWRARLLRRPARAVTRRQAWGLLGGGLALLPVAAAALWWLLPLRQGGLSTVLLMLTVTGLTLPALLLLQRSGAGEQALTLRRPRLWLLLLFAGCLLLVAAFIGRLPIPQIAAEIWSMAGGIRQFQDPRNFISLAPDRNAHTWFHFFAWWPLSGAWMQLFGAGFHQARFFYLLPGWLALPFLYRGARLLHGRTAAFAATAMAMFIPLHYGWAYPFNQVFAANSIALCAWVSARAAGGRRPLLWRYVCGFSAVSAVDGHPYGLAFALMFCVLQVAEFLRGPRDGQAARALRAFVAGCGSYSLLWGGYHIALPGLYLSELPGILRQTWEWESRIGASQYGVGLTAGNLVHMARLYLYHLTHEFLLVLPVTGLTLWQWRRVDRPLLAVFLGSALLIGLVLGHVNEYYFLFFLPFICIWFGAWLARLRPAAAGALPRGAVRLSFVATYLLGATLLLYALQAAVMANSAGLMRARAVMQRLEAAGREIDALLPAGDIVVAGHAGYYAGMPQRLNYASGFSFTWEQPAYWPLAEPQAIIFSRGVDEGYSGLGHWLRERDFRAAGCFAVPEHGAGVAVLYVLPELLPPEGDTKCGPADLAWLAAGPAGDLGNTGLEPVTSPTSKERSAS